MTSTSSQGRGWEGVREEGCSHLLPPKASGSGFQNPASIPTTPELLPRSIPQCTWATCSLSPVPPSPTSLPRLSLSLLLDVIYTGNAESDKPRVPRQKQWQRRVQGRRPSLDTVLKR